MRLTDIFCGLNAFWKDCLGFFAVDCEGFDVETLLVLRVCQATLELVEVPCYEHVRIHGTSNFRTFENGWRVLKMIMKEWLNGRAVIERVRRARPSQHANKAWNDLASRQPMGAMQ